MKEDFVKSLINIKSEAHGMLENLGNIKGRRHAEVVHACILAEQLCMIGRFLRDCSDDETQEVMHAINRAIDAMVGKIMNYYVRSVAYTPDEMRGVMEDMQMILRSTEKLMHTASDMADRGQVLGE